MNLSVPDSMTVGQNYVVHATYTPEAESSALTLTFAGSDSSNNPYFVDPNMPSTHYYLSNVALTPGAPLLAYEDRDLGPYASCFLSGVLIATPDGARPVEHLAIGDLVLTHDGRAIPVKWLGRQAVSARFNQREDRAPICIAAGALGPNLPAQDLKLTADHALLLDGVLVQAGALVNGTTIRKLTRAETGDHYTVWHIETEDHEVILAEGCPAETFVDNVGRQCFDNYAEYLTLYGDAATSILELDIPRIKSVRQSPLGLRAVVAARRAA